MTYFDIIMKLVRDWIKNRKPHQPDKPTSVTIPVQEEKTPETTNPAKDDDKKEVTKKPGIVFDMGDDSFIETKELIELSVKKIHDMVAEYITESGEAEPVRVIFKINDSNLVADRYWLEVRLPPQGIEKRLWERALFFGADKDSCDTFVSMLLEFGTRQDILDNLKDPALIERVIREVPDMSYHLEDL